MTLTTTHVDPMLLPDPRPAGSVARSSVAHALAAAILWLMPLLVIFVPAALISSGLRNGWKGFVGSTAGAAALLSLVLVAASPSERFTYGSQIALLVTEVGLGAAAATLLIRRGKSSGSVLLAGLVGSTAGFLLTEAAIRSAVGKSVYGTVLEEFRTNAVRMVEAWRVRGATQDVLTAMQTASETLAASFVPSILMIGMIVSFAVSLVLIPRLPVGIIAGVGDTLRFRALRLPDWLLVGFVIGGLSPLATGIVREIGLNVLVVVVFLYILQGLAIYRAMLARLQFGFFGMAFAFLLLLFLTQFFVAPVMLFLAGLFDPFFDFRKLHRKDESNESNSD
jgi:hypothetical protein